MDSSEAGDRLLGQVIADRYHITEVLGEGGMGRVYLAEHVRIGRRSAVKVMSPNMALSADAISRFNREAANAARINHPNVAQIYDFGETADGVLYLAMEFVEGETLRAIINRDGPLPPARAANLTKQIADALAAAHHLGIVHRDLKPDNIMVARHHDGSDWVKVVDFGIAKTVQGSGDPGSGSQTVTTAGVSLGTPEYMSPEQLAGERLDARTDLYSLGLVLFNMLTGDLPYPKLTSRETLVRRLTSKPHTLAEVAPGVEWPPELQAALDRALAPETKDRYESVRDFGNDVTKAVAGFDPNATLRVRSKTARLSGPTVVVSPPREPVPEPSGPHARKRGSYKASIIAVVVVIALVGTADGMYVAFRAGEKAVTPTRVTHATPPAPAVPKDTTPAVVPRDTAPDVVPQASVVAAPRPTTPPAPTKKKEKPARDSSAVKVAPPPVVDGATPAPAVTVVERNSRRTAHSWLRANGDSGATRVLAPNATDADRVQLFVDEIRGHMMRANQFLSQADVQKARSELRDVGQETQMFRMLFPAASDSLHIEQGIRAGGMRLMQTCQRTIADTTKHFPPTFTCQQLVPPMMRGRQGQGRGGVPFR